VAIIHLGIQEVHQEFIFWHYPFYLKQPNQPTLLTHNHSFLPNLIHCAILWSSTSYVYCVNKNIKFFFLLFPHHELQILFLLYNVLYILSFPKMFKGSRSMFNCFFISKPQTSLKYINKLKNYIKTHLN
jgi:hypothetical protein